MNPQILDQALKNIRQARHLAAMQPVSGAEECLRLLEQCRQTCEQALESATEEDASRLRDSLLSLSPLLESALKFSRAGFTSGYQADGSACFHRPTIEQGTLV